ncbi:helix-turn-helix domain-containing protein [Duganella sp. FT92W]|uniref:Helix-turn-helix domain-containing protein n=1 Tax=Pseudoduganella rivuli TaxID=2666085 RepID=A0A7X2IQ20_9BURK|nr:helix-turn-helix domain-containing protein [Pseudoduganella rivuli]MRV73687.1 helix-turn-helix domain-containing protein [Pseudoduganella rivuli]
MARQPRTPQQDVPQFALYGEQQRAEGAELVHIETIQARSRLHDWHIGRHTHKGLFQVLFLMKGHVRAAVGDAVWLRSGPAVITIHPALEHGFDFSEEAQGYVLTIDEQLVYSAGRDRGDLFAPLFIQPLAMSLETMPELHARIAALLESLMAEAAWPHYGHAHLLEWLACSVLVLLTRALAEHQFAQQSGRGDFELFSRFRAVVEQRYKEQWQVGQYADALHISPIRLNRLCLKVAGQTAFDIAQDRLMLEACRKLTYAPSPVASICYELGFQDPAYFSRLFKKRIGLTPKQFRQQSQAGEA